jgi:hypothetical protein
MITLAPDDNIASQMITVFYSPARYTGQGGSDKSRIYFFLLLNYTTQLKIIRFY